jgi:STE24 endopeptidase
MTSRMWAALTLAVLVAALVVVAAIRVPWTAPPAPRADQLDALRQMPAEAVARGRAFHAALRPASYSSMAIGLVLAFGLGLTPLGARLIALVGRPFGGHWLAEAIIGGAVIVLVGELLALPLGAWQETVLRRYGLSTQTWRSWTVDLLKGYAIGVVLGVIAVVGFYGLARLAPRTWWIWTALGAAALVVALSFVFPVLVEPVFNTFTPMPAGQLREDLMTMAARDGVPVKDVLVADASRRTTALNAYVSGLGPTRRIVVYDTLLNTAPPREVKSVVAHELGHAKRHDVLTGTLLGALGSAAAICAVYLLGSWRGLLRLSGVDTIGTPRSIALLLALAAAAGLVFGPVQNLVSRRLEARADGHELALTDDPQTAEQMTQRLALTNLADVDPNWLEYLMFATHPSTVERMAAARAYARGRR